MSTIKISAVEVSTVEKSTAEISTATVEMSFPEVETAAAKQPQERLKILVVDDLLENLRLLSSLLTKAGYEVRSAPDGTLALGSVPHFQPDLILLDIMMPDINGYEVCQQIKANQQTQNIPIIFLSALDLTFDKVKAFEVGASDYIQKPFHPAEVIARINNQIRIRQQFLQIQAQQAIIERQQQQLKALQAPRFANSVQYGREDNMPNANIRA